MGGGRWWDYRVAMRERFASVAVILSTGGAQLDLQALRDLPHARVVRVEVARGERASCVAATLEHACSTADLVALLKPWASGRGWSITVAPLVGPR